MSATFDLAEVGEAGIHNLDPTSGRCKDFAGERRKSHGNRDRRGDLPAARAAACPASQYHRAAEAPVPVSQYSVMLSRMLSRVRLPAGLPSTNAREIL